MSYHIPDEPLKQAGITEAEACVELACRLYDIGRLSLFQARELAGLASRTEMEAELVKRGLPILRPTEQDLAEDIRNLDALLGPSPTSRP